MATNYNHGHIVRFKDLVFKPHPVSLLFEGQAIVIMPNNHRISIVGPRKDTFIIDTEDIGKYEILYSLWGEPIGYLTEEEVDIMLVKIQKGPLDIIPELNLHKFIQ